MGWRPLAELLDEAATLETEEVARHERALQRARERAEQEMEARRVRSGRRAKAPTHGDRGFRLDAPSRRRLHRLLAEGRSKGAVAREVGVSPQTIDYHARRCSCPDALASRGEPQ